MFPRPVPVRDRVRPDCAYIHRELKRDGVTLQLLWEEHLQVHPSGYRYTQFCELYRQWVKRLRPSMRQIHRAGEKTFIDFSGKRPSLVDRRTGELRPVELFVSVLGASRLTYAEATRTQQLPDWVNAHIRMAEYFGGSTTMWVPRPAEKRHHPPLPLRARRQPHLLRLGRPLRRGRHPGAAEETSRAAGRGRSACYVLAQWKRCSVNIDYHVAVEHHVYSVPYQLVREQVEVRYTTRGWSRTCSAIPTHG